MQTLRNRHTPEMRVMLRTLQIVALAGLVIGIVTLAKATAPYAEWRLMLYISWFAIAVISAEAILYWLKAGVHALLGMTLLVTIIEVVSGSASLGGASLGLLMILILVGYLYPLRHQFD